jgi:hypothetical protein
MNWYALLLRAYPADHPRDEMLGVLEENSRPWWREAPALIVGALRARSGGNQSVPERWLYAARAAALMLLVASALAPVDDLHWGTELLTRLTIVTWICAGLAAAWVVVGARWPAFALSLAALAASATDEISMTAVAGYALAAVLLLLPGRPMPVANPLPALLAVAFALDLIVPEQAESMLLAALLLWTLIDERILLAAGLALFAGLITAVSAVTEVTDMRGLLIFAAWRIGLPALLVALAAVLTHRRAKV